MTRFTVARLACRRRLSAAGAAISLVLAAGLPAPGVAQQEAVATQIILSALPSIRSLAPEGPAVLNAEPLCRARLVGWSCPSEVRQAADSLGLILGSRNFTYVCLGGEASCRLLGARSLISFSTPEVRGRRASVDAEMVAATGQPTDTLIERRHRVHLARRRAGWQVIRVDSLP